MTRDWERGVTTTYAYDQGALDTVTYTSDATNTPNVAYTYDNFGRPTIVAQSKNGAGTSPLATITYTYDAATLALASETIGYDTNADGDTMDAADLVRTINRYQDSQLRPLSAEITGEYTTAYGYDVAGRLNKVWDQPTLNATTHLPSGATGFTYAYQANSYGLVKTLTGPAHTVDNAYEANRNVLLNKNNHTGTLANPVSKYDYAVSGATTTGANNLGQRKNLATTGLGFDGTTFTNTAATGSAFAWTYNGRGELTEASDTSAANNDRAFQYDGIGNRQKTVNGLLGALPGTANYVANSQNQYSTANGIVLPTTPAPSPYDADGNYTHGPIPVATGNATLEWDGENRLIEITRADTTVISYSYDFQGRRISKKVGSGTTELYIYDGWNLIAEYTGTTHSSSYTWGMDLSGSMQGAGGVGGLLAVNDGSATYYPTYDGNGNVSEYLDSTGAVKAHYEYDAFGKTTVSTGTKKADFIHRFSTKPLDAETGLYYYGYRYYDPVTGRWPSRDPIGERGGVNLYGFVGNNGIGELDYLGLECKQKPGSFTWVRFPVPTGVEVSWAGTGNGGLTADTVTITWEGRASVECCCDGKTWFKAEGDMIAEVEWDVHGEAFIPGGSPLPAISISTPTSIVAGVGSLIAGGVAGAMPVIPAGASPAMRQGILDLITIIANLPSGAPDSEWKDGWPCGK